MCGTTTIVDIRRQKVNGNFSEEGMLMAVKQREVVPPRAKKAYGGAYMSSTHFYHHHWMQVMTSFMIWSP